MDNNKTIQEATTHDLKTWEVYFTAILDGRKRFEIRKNDRGFKKGDHLLLKEWNHITRSFTNRELTVKVDYIIKDAPSFGLADGYCIMSISPLSTHPIADAEQEVVIQAVKEWIKVDDEYISNHHYTSIELGAITERLQAAKNNVIKALNAVVPSTVPATEQDGFTGIGKLANKLLLDPADFIHFKEGSHYNRNLWEHKKDGYFILEVAIDDSNEHEFYLRGEHDFFLGSSNKGLDSKGYIEIDFQVQYT